MTGTRTVSSHLCHCFLGSQAAWRAALTALGGARAAAQPSRHADQSTELLGTAS